MSRSRLLTAGVAFMLVGGSLAACGDGGGQGGAADGDGVVVLYTSEVASSKIIAEEYEAASGVKVEVVTGSSGELLSRIQSEAGNPQGDVYFGAGQQAVENPDLFELPEGAEGNSIDPQWITDINLVPITMWVNGIMYNKDLVPEAEVPRATRILPIPSGRARFRWPIRRRREPHMGR